MVILPEKKRGPFPVFYLLHGLSDDHTAWVRRTSLDKPSSGDLAAGLPNEAAIGLSYEQLDAVLCGLAQGLPEGAVARQAGVSRKVIHAVQRAIRTTSAREGLPGHL